MHKLGRQVGLPDPPDACSNCDLANGRRAALALQRPREGTQVGLAPDEQRIAGEGHTVQRWEGRDGRDGVEGQGRQQLLGSGGVDHARGGRELDRVLIEVGLTQLKLPQAT